MSVLTDKSAISVAAAATKELSWLGVSHGPIHVLETAGSSLVFLAQPGARQPAYCLKVRKPVRSIPPTARKADQLPTALEFKMLVSVREHFARLPEFPRSLVRPVRLLADHDAILTEYSDGRLLKDKLPLWGNMVASAWNMKRMLSVLESCGAWLSHLHSMPPPEWLPVYRWNDERVQKKTLETVARLPEPLRGQLPIHDLLGQISDFRQRDQRLVVSHGDFQPGNILVSGSGITIVDLALAGLRPIEDDLAFFVALMFTQKHRVVFGDLVGSTALVRELCDTFLASYGLPGADGWARVRPMVASHVVERLAQMSASIRRLPPIVQPFLISRLVAWTRSELPLLIEPR